MPLRVSDINETSGRKEGSRFQQRCISIHKPFVNFGCVGRGGRTPSIMLNTTIKAEIRPKGTAPVNTCNRPYGRKLKLKGNISAVYLNYDHCKGENIRLLAV